MSARVSTVETYVCAGSNSGRLPCGKACGSDGLLSNRFPQRPSGRSSMRDFTHVKPLNSNQLCNSRGINMIGSQRARNTLPF